MQSQPTPKSLWRADQKNWMMDDLSIEFIKEAIDNHKFQYKYWVCLNYEMSDYDWLNDTKNFDDRVTELKSYLDHLASRQKNHIVSWVGAYLDWEKPHFHLVLCCEKPLKIQKAKDAWLQGRPSNQLFRDYEPDFCETRGLEPEDHCVFYTYRFHRAINTRHLHCPCKKSRCRNGNCPHND